MSMVLIMIDSYNNFYTVAVIEDIKKLNCFTPFSNKIFLFQNQKNLNIIYNILTHSQTY